MDFRLYDRPPRWTVAGVCGALAVGLPLTGGIGALYGWSLGPALAANREGRQIVAAFLVCAVAILLVMLFAAIFWTISWRQISNLWVAGLVGASLGAAAFYGLTAAWVAGHVGSDGLVLSPWGLGDRGWELTQDYTWTWTSFRSTWRVPVWVNRCIWVLEFQVTCFFGVFAGLAAASGRPCEVCQTEISRLARYRRVAPVQLEVLAGHIDHGSLTLLREALAASSSPAPEAAPRSLVVGFHGCLECLRTLLISVALKRSDREAPEPILVDAVVSPAVFEALLQVLDPQEAADFREGVDDFPEDHWAGVGAWRRDDQAIPSATPDLDVLHRGNQGPCAACDRAVGRFDS